MPALIRSSVNLRRFGFARKEHGAASLVVVLMLFFVIALVSAYTSRNLIFEQRTSVNQYRSSMAFEAAEAGVEWALAMLNGGRIGADCTEATALANSTSFRQRYLRINETSGIITARTQLTDPTKKLMSTCVWTETGWACNCPDDDLPVVAAPTTPGLHPAFTVFFDPDLAPVPRPGAIRIQVNGCVAMNDACLRDFSALAQQSEGRAQHSTLVALKSALTTPPPAALTVFGNANVAGAGPPAVVQNADAASGGIAIHAAGLVHAARFDRRGPPGAPISRSLAADDATLVPNGLSLADLTSAAPVQFNRDRVFGSVFGLLPATYRDQPAARVLPCPNTGCRAAVAALVAANPQRVIWISGDLVLESAGDIGTLPNAADPTVTGPATIVVEGRLRFLTPGVNIFGVVYTRNGDWEGTGTITGAAMVEGNFFPNSYPTVVYDQSVINATRLGSGSFVPVQGDWRDFIKLN